MTWKNAISLRKLHIFWQCRTKRQGGFEILELKM